MPILENQVNNPELALMYANLLRQLRSLNPLDNISAIIAADLGEVTFATANPGSPTNLAWYYGGNNLRRIFLIDGVRNSYQASALINGYTASGFTGGAAPVNEYVLAQRNLIGGAIGFDTLSRQENLDFVGYSAGGAVCQALAHRMLQYEFRPKMKCATFGSPRAGVTSFGNVLNVLPIARWMNSADPIPLVPLRLQDAPQIAVVLTLNTVLAWSAFVHTQGGISINPDNTTSPAIVGPRAAASPIGSISNWYFGVEDDPSNAHSLTTYVSNLQGIVRVEQLPASVVADEAPREHSTAVRRQEVNQQRNRIQVAIFDQASNQTERPIQTPELLLLRAFRQGRVWYVSFNDQIVITAGPEKRARHIARAGNDFLRSLQKQAVVDPSAILEQLTQFFALAQDPTTGFVPTINTTPPS